MLSPGELAARLNRLSFAIQLVGHQKCEPTWRSALRPIKHPSFWLIVKGKGTVHINGTYYPAEPGKLFFFLPGMQVERKTDFDHPLEYYFVRFYYTEIYYEKEQWILRNATNCPFPLEGMYTLQNTPQLINLLEQLIALWKRRGAMTTMRRSILLQELLLSVALDFRAQEIAGDTTAAIELTQEYMSQHYREPLALDDLAHLAGLSISHYSRLFKKYSGYSPIDYLTHLRVDRAKELLVLSDYRLKSIAGAVGYTDEFYFSRIFKKIEGLSPREYSKKHRAASLPNITR